MYFTYNEHKYFKVKAIVTNDGKQSFRVFGYDSWLYLLLDAGTEYSKHNETIIEALQQIDTIKANTAKTIQTVYKTKAFQ